MTDSTHGQLLRHGRQNFSELRATLVANPIDGTPAGKTPPERGHRVSGVPGTFSYLISIRTQLARAHRRSQNGTGGIQLNTFQDPGVVGTDARECKSSEIKITCVTGRGGWGYYAERCLSRFDVS